MRRFMEDVDKDAIKLERLERTQIHFFTNVFTAVVVVVVLA